MLPLMLLNVADVEKINTDDFVKKDAISSSISSSSTTNVANSAAVKAINDKVGNTSSGKWDYLGRRETPGLWTISGGLRIDDTLIIMPHAVAAATFNNPNTKGFRLSSYGGGAPYFQFTHSGYRTANIMAFDCIGGDVTLNIGTLSGEKDRVNLVAYVIRNGI